MTRPLYSTLFYAHSFASAASDSVGPVPAGEIWVVRDIVATAQIPQLTASEGFWVADQDFVQIFAVRNYNSARGETYHYDGRQVLNAGNFLEIFADAGWSLRISGYTLTVT